MYNRVGHTFPPHTLYVTEFGCVVFQVRFLEETHIWHSGTTRFRVLVDWQQSPIPIEAMELYHSFLGLGYGINLPRVGSPLRNR